MNSNKNILPFYLTGVSEDEFFSNSFNPFDLSLVEKNKTRNQNTISNETLIPDNSETIPTDHEGSLDEVSRNSPLPNFNETGQENPFEFLKPQRERDDNWAQSIMYKYLQNDMFKFYDYKEKNGLPKLECHTVLIGRNRKFTKSLSEDDLWNFLFEIAFFVLNFKLEMLKSNTTHDISTYNNEKKRKIYYSCVGYNESTLKKFKFAELVTCVWECALTMDEANQKNQPLT